MESVSQPSGVTLGNGIVVLLAAKKAANLRPRYLHSLQCYLSIFARGREEMLLSDISVEILEQWFAARQETPMSQRGSLGRLGSLFAFAVRRRWIAINPISQFEKPRIDHKPPAILTPEQAQRLMECVMQSNPQALAFFSLALFGGIRPQELEAVTWDNFNGTTVTIDSAAAKTRRRRVVHLNENAVEWVSFAKEINALLPFNLSKRTWALRKAAKRIGLENGWPMDILRHSCASYWLAISNNVGLVAKELGNSPAVLLTHYQELVTAENASLFWSIRP